MTEYVKSIVSFIDILGFGNRVTERNEDGSYADPPDEIEVILDRFYDRSGYDLLGVPSRPGELSIFQFSDCAIRCARATNAVYDYEWPVRRAAEIVSIGVFQFMLAAEGTFIRGGMTEGDIRIYRKEDKAAKPAMTKSEMRVFGPALIEAYELERHKAIVPRIVLEPAVVPQFKKALSEQNTVNGFMNDRNDRAYIDYLRVSRWFYDQGSFIDSYPSALDSHRKMIVANLGEHTDERILAKYRWLADYHNSFLDDADKEWSAFPGIDRENLRIDAPYSALKPKS